MKDVKKKLYIIQSGDSYKIGVSKNPSKRLFSLKLGNPDKDMELIYESSMLANPYDIEYQAHFVFYRYSLGREWFRGIDKDKLIQKVDAIVRANGIVST